MIDICENEESFVDVSASNIFKINENITINDFYQYIPIHQTSLNSDNNNRLDFIFIEFSF